VLDCGAAVVESTGATLAVAAEGSYFLSRMHRTTAVFTTTGQRTDLLDLLGPHPSYDHCVVLGCTQRLPVRIAIDPAANADRSLRLGLSVHLVVDTLGEPRAVPASPEAAQSGPR